MQSITDPNTIILKDLQVGYHSKKKPGHAVFGPAQACISQSEMVGVIGRNGIGKSTLLRTIAGLQPALSGTILINQKPVGSYSLGELAKTVSFVSTEPVFAFQIRVDELIAMGRHPHTGWLGKLNNADREAIDHAIEISGVAHLIHKSVHEISDGERQKVMIARALAQDTPVIILDEPTAYLDVPSRYEILNILGDLSVRSNKTILFSTHDLSMAADIADKLWLMADNTIYEGAPEDLLISRVFRKLFINSPAGFDAKTSTFRFTRKLNRQITIRGEKKYMMLTRRAMERIGFRTDESGSEMIIELSEKEEKPMWVLHFDKGTTSFHSLYSLATYLKFHNR